MESIGVDQWWQTFDPLFHRMGPYAPLVAALGAVMTAAFAIWSLFGFIFVKPPIDADIMKRTGQFLTALTAVLLTGFFIAGQNGIPLTPFAVIGLAGAPVLYLFLIGAISWLTVKCEHYPPVLAGLWLAPDAAKVLDRDFNGLPDERQIKVPPYPSNAKEYYCTSGHTLSWVWTDFSQTAALCFVVCMYMLAYIFLVGGISAATLQLLNSQPKIEHSGPTTVVSIPAQTLFDFDSAKISPAANAYLEIYAKDIRKSGAQIIQIVGHTDAKGTREYNQALSERRAIAVRNWLIEKGQLGAIKIQVEGRGSRTPLQSETDSRGHDLPEARQANRRVEITYKVPSV